MKLEEIKVKGGIVSKICNIEETDGVWQFKNGDPQIEVTFDKSVDKIRIISDYLGYFNSDNIEIFFRNQGENFSENKKVSFSRRFSEITYTDIFFDQPYDTFRIDLDNNNSQCKFLSFEILPIRENIKLVKEMEKNFSPVKKEKEKLLIVSHDFSNTGAPILAFNIAKELYHEVDIMVICLHMCKEKDLEEKYKNNQIPYIYINDFSCAKYSFYGCVPNSKYESLEDMKQQLFLEAARNLNFDKAITNTIVSGEIVSILKDYDFKIISLIHEMANTIKMYGFASYGKDIAANSDYIVFPNEIVKNDFLSIFPNLAGKVCVRPQGVYLNLDFELALDDEVSRFGFSLSDNYIIGSGTGELRKGIDLFVNSAISLCNKYSNLHFVWTGSFTSSELESWMKFQIKKSNLENRIHLLPFITDSNLYKTVLSNAKAFWLTSREDPFPSVALEAMAYNVPVVGFSNSGGFSFMAEDNRALHCLSFDCAELIDKTIQILEGTIRLNSQSVKNYIKDLDFGDYCQSLLSLTKNIKTVKPSLNVYKYQNSSIPHYFDLQNGSNKYNLEDIPKPNLFIKHKINLDYVTLLDTAIGSDNVGDQIIMSYCEKICTSTLPNSVISHIPTHIYKPEIENIENQLKILCGTNLLYKEMEISRQMVFPKNIRNMKNTCLLGVGMQQIGLEKTSSEYTKKLLNFMLNNSYLHSVRDQQTKDFLNSIGIKNVVNTSCPTMWNLTPDHCQLIPMQKQKSVLTTVTDYAKDPVNDALMIEILKSKYDTVYLWVQGQCDYSYLKKITECRNLCLVPPTLKALDALLNNNDLDYIGTRLHAGIRSLNKFHRSLVIAVDNRARAIHKDTGLPIMERFQIPELLVNWIDKPYQTKIHLPQNDIDAWKSQFNY